MIKHAINNITAELYYKCDAMLGEGPVWADGTLYWIDITGKAIFAKRDEATSATKYEVGLEIGSFAIWNDDEFILATERGFQCFNLQTRKLIPWSNPEDGLPDNRFNDGKCDPRGRFVAGTFNRRGENKGALYVLDHDKSVRKIFGPAVCSNGLAWTEDGGTLYYIDSPTHTVRSFVYDLEKAKLSYEHVALKMSQLHAVPDGMTIDHAGNLWIALWDGWGVECWDPRTGNQLARIEVPAARVTSCIFGGNNYDTLFITTARSGLDNNDLKKQKLAGSVFIARPGVSGYPAIRFSGT